MMFGAGLMMILIFLLPVVLIVAVVAAIAASGAGGWQRWLGSHQAQAGADDPTPAAGRYCAHCGQALQAGWSHCPYCGASSSDARQ